VLWGVKSRKIVISVGVVAAVTLPYWEVIPAVSYLLEIILAALLMMAVIEGGIRLMLFALAAGFIIGAVPGLATMPLAFFLPIWLKATVPAIVLGVMVSHGRHAGRSFAAASALAALFVLFVYAQAAGILAEQIEIMSESVGSLITTTMGTQGYTPEMINELTDSLARFKYWIINLLPGILIMSVIGQLFIAFILMEWYYTRRDSYFPGFGAFIYWKVPEKLLYLLGAVLAAALMVQGDMKIAAYNIIFILSFFYGVCGLALIEHLLRRLRLPLFIKIVFYLGLFLMQLPGLILASVAGLIDSHFDFRKVRAHSLG
jgi:hypothetical protein